MVDRIFIHLSIHFRTSMLTQCRINPSVISVKEIHSTPSTSNGQQQYTNCNGPRRTVLLKDKMREACRILSSSAVPLRLERRIEITCAFQKMVLLQKVSVCLISYFEKSHSVSYKLPYFATARNVVPRQWTVIDRLLSSSQDLSYRRLWTSLKESHFALTQSVSYQSITESHRHLSKKTSDSTTFTAVITKTNYFLRSIQNTTQTAKVLIFIYT